jgi:MtN3 and saliva related transmembrane protein
MWAIWSKQSQPGGLQKAREADHIASQHLPVRKVGSLSSSVELLGALAAVTTTLCWLPQLFKIMRERQASGVSLVTNAALAGGVFLWCVYGVLIASWPVIAANAVTLLFILAIVGLKLRYG